MMGYGETDVQAKQAMSLLGDKLYDPTIAENIDRQIAELEARIANLKAHRQNLEKTGLLPLKISTLREAMNY